MRCNLITDLDNDVGLATDRELLGGFLRDLWHEVTEVDWRSNVEPAEPADVNFFIEKFNPKWLRRARHNIGIFNLEWFSSDWMIYLHDLTQIWTKSAAAHEWFMDHGCDNAHFTGFLSRNTFRYDVHKRRAALHIAGRSNAKGTQAVLRAYWNAHTAGVLLPVLTIVSKLPIDPLPPRVARFGWTSRLGLDAMINCHRFHLCPSEVEGWGHYITEATACGGIVITTDASPMNEHVLPTFGRLLQPRLTAETVFGRRWTVEPQAIVAALQELSSLSDDTLDVMGTKARNWNHQRNRSFAVTVGDLLNKL
jgi:hypothetical protein